MLESLIDFCLDASLRLLLLRTVSSDDLLGISEVCSDGLRVPELLGSYKTQVVRSTDLNGEVLQGSSLDCVDREFVVGVNGRKTSRNLVQKHRTG